MQKSKIYKIGDTVEHETFGIGIVIEKYRSKNNTLVVKVKFDVDVKPIVARFQGMHKIK